MIRERLARLRAKVHEILSANLTPAGIGWAVGIGLFIGALPLYGVHFGVCLVVARLFRLNEAVMYGAANISNPLFAPFLIAAEIEIGEYMRYGTLDGVSTATFGHSFWDTLKTTPDLFISCCYGSVALGIVLGVVLGPLAWAIARWRQQRLGT